jgi:hypothetical protein
MTIKPLFAKNVTLGDIKIKKWWHFVFHAFMGNIRINEIVPHVKNVQCKHFPTQQELSPALRAPTELKLKLKAAHNVSIVLQDDMVTIAVIAVLDSIEIQKFLRAVVRNAAPEDIKTKKGWLCVGSVHWDSTRMSLVKPYVHHVQPTRLQMNLLPPSVTCVELVKNQNKEVLRAKNVCLEKQELHVWNVAQVNTVEKRTHLIGALFVHLDIQLTVMVVQFVKHVNLENMEVLKKVCAVNVCMDSIKITEERKNV